MRPQHANLLARRMKQVGAFSLDLIFALIVSALAASAAYMASMRAADATSAGLQGQTLLSLQTAANKLVMNNYAAYQASLPVTVNGVVLAAGAASGQTDNFTVAQLAAMNLGVTNAQPNGSYKALTDASYQFSISRTAACAATPGSIDCHVSGLVCLNKPIKSYSAPVGEIDSQAIGSIFGVMGSAVGASFPASTGTITGADGTWTTPNPYGNVAGIVCAHFGYGSANDDYLRVGDTRDPNFQNNVSVAGDVNVAGNTNVTGNVVTNGMTLNSTVALGGACPTEAAAAWAQSAGKWTFARCSSGVWVSVAGPDGAVPGAACSVTGALGVDPTGAGLTCNGGIWQNTLDRMGKYTFYASYIVSSGDVVDKPTCNGVAFSSSSRAYMASGSEAQTKFQYVDRFFTDNGNSWTVNILDENGAAIAGTSVAEIYCYYP